MAAIRPAAYARSRNALDGAVTGLSPYITHGLVTLAEVLAGVCAREPLLVQHKLVYELGWREYFRHVWQQRGDAIFSSLHAGPLPDTGYAQHLPEDIRQAATGVPVIDQAVRSLYVSGYLHNHARMWLASYTVHLRKVHWRAGADWLYTHLLDGDLASNHLSWQWVAGSASHKPYLFNADNVARYAPPAWHSPGTVIDQDYATLERWSRQPVVPEQCRPLAAVDGEPARATLAEPPGLTEPWPELGAIAPEPEHVAGRDVWLVHPWNLGPLPGWLDAQTLVLGLWLQDFHSARPWSALRWRFVASRMAELAPRRWYGSAQAVGAALESARTVRSSADPHLAPWLQRWAKCEARPSLFAPVVHGCDSFSQWWRRAAQGCDTAAELLAQAQARSH